MYNQLKCLLVSLFLSIGLASWADDCIVDGIYYELDANKKEASVRPCGDGRYQGSVIIPASIQYFVFPAAPFPGSFFRLSSSQARRQDSAAAGRDAAAPSDEETVRTATDG